MISKKTSMIIAVLCMILLVSCGEKAAETEVVVEQPEEPAVEETVVAGDESVAVDVSSGEVNVNTEEASVTVDTEEASVPEEVEEIETIEMKIESYAFEEKILTLKAGTTVIWTNYDSAPHTVTATSGADFDSGKLSKGDTWEYTFTEPGTYAYKCSYHPSMTAKVIVE